MFKIGDFSRFSRVSVKMLRHYDEIGLLKPAHVDSLTNYRYYSADQLPRLNRIIALKELGFTLEQIARLLDDELPAEQIKGMLKLKRAEIEQQLQAEERRLAQVEIRLRQIELEEQLPAYDVIVRDIDPQWVASIRRPVRFEGDEVGDAFETIEAYVARYKARALAPPLIPITIRSTGSRVLILRSPCRSTRFYRGMSKLWFMSCRG
jgi:DNA-binding transcriptional MerR regulator